MNTRKTEVIILHAIVDLDGEPKREIRLAPAGIFRARDGRPKDLPGWKLDELSAGKIINAVSAQSDRLVIDYDHQTLYAQINGQPAPAAGWFKKLEWRVDGLYAIDVEWTRNARQKITDKEYRYVSPVIASDPETGEVKAVAMAALVNYPAIDGLEDLAAAHVDLNNLFSTRENPMDKELLKLLGLPETVDSIAVLNAVTALKAKHDGLKADLDKTKTDLTALQASLPDTSKFVPLAVVTELQTQLAALSVKQESAALEKLIADNLKKLPTPGLQTWAKSQTVEALSAYLQNAVEVPALTGMQTDGQAPAGSGQNALAATTEELEAAKHLGMDVQDLIKMRAN